MDLNVFLDLDDRLTARLRIAEKPGLLRSAAIFLGHSGDSWYWFLAMLLVLLSGSPAWQLLALFIIAAIFVSAAIVLVIKFTVRRARPEGELGQIYRKTDPHSFPSGHAARAVLLALIALGAGPPWVAAILVIWAPLVGLARVAIGVHYLSDVVAGWLIGALLGLAALQVWGVFLV